jgi:predicted transcriptional regulator
MKVLRIGIASTGVFKARTIAVAKGHAKLKVGEPKVWFNSAQSVGKLIDDNWPTPARRADAPSAGVSVAAFSPTG